MDLLVKQGIVHEGTISHIKKEYGDKPSIQIVAPDIVFKEAITPLSWEGLLAK